MLSAYADHEARVEHEHPAEPYPDVLARSFSALGRRLGLGVSAEEAHGLAASVPDWPAYGDSHDALVALSKHFKLIILSNVDRQSFVASNRLLDVVFDMILTAEDIGSYKPAARNFEVLVNEVGRLGIAKASCFTSPRACSTITSRQRTPDFPPYGSTVATDVPVGGPPRPRLPV